MPYVLKWSTGFPDSFAKNDVLCAAAGSSLVRDHGSIRLANGSPVLHTARGAEQKRRLLPDQTAEAPEKEKQTTYYCQAAYRFV